MAIIKGLTATSTVSPGSKVATADEKESGTTFNIYLKEWKNS
jgi:hypothetical protein